MTSATRQAIENQPVPNTTQSVAGFMRFDIDDLELLHALLMEHPVV